MKMKVKVSAQAFCPHTGNPIADQRDEIVDIKNNPIFRECTTLTDVQEAYESFWNRFPTNQKEMVLVQKLAWV